MLTCCESWIGTGTGVECCAAAMEAQRESASARGHGRELLRSVRAKDIFIRNGGHAHRTDEMSMCVDVRRLRARHRQPVSSSGEHDASEERDAGGLCFRRGWFGWEAGTASAVRGTRKDRTCRIGPGRACFSDRHCEEGRAAVNCGAALAVIGGVLMPGMRPIFATHVR
jgi:hypothetical protein